MVKRSKIVFLLFIFALFSCKKESKALPEGILSQEKMIAVMADLQVIEAAHKKIRIPGKEHQPMKDTSYQIVFNKHQVTWDQYDSSLSAYTLHPEIFTRMLEKVGTTLNTTSIKE